jgi:hypothetical protein
MYIKFEHNIRHRTICLAKIFYESIRVDFNSNQIIWYQKR